MGNEILGKAPSQTEHDRKWFYVEARELVVIVEIDYTDKVVLVMDPMKRCVNGTPFVTYQFHGLHGNTQALADGAFDRDRGKEVALMAVYQYCLKIASDIKDDNRCIQCGSLESPESGVARRVFDLTNKITLMELSRPA